MDEEDLRSMEFKSERLELLRGIMDDCQKSGDDGHIWRTRKEGEWYCISPDDTPCEYRRPSQDDCIHRYRCRRDLK